MLKKSIPNLDGKAKYALNFRNIQLYLSLRMKLTKIHKVLKFKQFHWMKTYIDFNTKKKRKRKSANRFRNKPFKLMINSVYDKTMENLQKRINIRLVNSEKDFLKYTNRSAHKTHKIFGKSYAAIHEINT